MKVIGWKSFDLLPYLEIWFSSTTRPTTDSYLISHFCLGMVCQWIGFVFVKKKKKGKPKLQCHQRNQLRNISLPLLLTLLLPFIRHVIVCTSPGAQFIVREYLITTWKKLPFMATRVLGGSFFTERSFVIFRSCDWRGRLLFLRL